MSTENLSKMPLSNVHMPADVYYACCMHALTFEEEEIMGLLIGKFEDNVAYIKSTIVLQRSDKRKDRVEISTEQLHSAIMRTTELSETMGEQVYVLGWYHSHPHITVQPSHVDLRTQASYQTMDVRFFGIILSVFNEDKNKGQEIQITCFQATQIEGGYQPYKKVDIPLYIDRTDGCSTPCSQSVFMIPTIISEEDMTNYEEAKSSTQDLLNDFHNDSAFIMTQTHILKSVVNPLLLNAEMRLLTAEQTIKDLTKERDELLKQLYEFDKKGRLE